MPCNGWWHEWTFNYDSKVENNEAILDLAEREAKILVWRGDDYQPSRQPEAEPQPQPPSDATPVNEPSDKMDVSQQQPDSSTNPNPESMQTEGVAAQEQQQQQQ